MAALGRLWGSRLCPVRIQLQLGPAAPTHLCEACWPRGRHSEVGQGALPPWVWIQILRSRLQLIRARRGGGRPGIRLYPAARLRRGMVSPSPRTGGTGAHQQRRRCQAALGARSARGEQLAPRSRRPASAAQSTLQAVLRGDAAPPFRPLGPSPPPPRLLQKGARKQRRAPGKAPGARLQDPATGGAGRLPSSPTPRLPPPLFLLPLSFAL